MESSLQGLFPRTKHGIVPKLSTQKDDLTIVLTWRPRQNFSMMFGKPENIENQKTSSSFILIQTAFAGYPLFFGQTPTMFTRFAKARSSEELRKWVKSLNIGGVEFVGKMSHKMWANYGQHIQSLDDSYWDCCFLYSLVVWVRLGE